MGYNSNKGPQHSGDVQYEGDPTDTQIDFENDFVAIKTNGQQRFIVSGATITASVNISGSGDFETGGRLTADDDNFRVFGNAVRANDFRTPTTRIDATHVSSSLNISGSKIYADGVLLTPGVVSAVANGVNNRVSTFSSADALNGEANLTFDGSDLVVVGNVTASQGVTGSSLRTAATVIDGIHVSSSLNISGAAFYGDGSKLSGLTVPAIATYNNATDNRVITSVNNNTVQGEANLTFDGFDLSVVGNVSASMGITGSLLLSTGSTAQIAVGKKSPVNSNMLYVNTQDNDNRVPLLIVDTAERFLFAVSGSGKVVIGGSGAPYVDGQVNISGSNNEKLLTIKSDSHNPALYVSGSGNAFVGANMEISSSLTIRNSDPPAANGSPGIPGEIRWDANYLYVCTAIDTWKRVALVGGW
jgi:hypothetical protein